MRYRVLGKTGLRVSEIGFGGWAIGGNAFGRSYGNTDDAESLIALQKAYELGCNVFATADHFGHGHSERLIGQALKSWPREELVIITQGGQEFGGAVVSGTNEPEGSAHSTGGPALSSTGSELSSRVGGKPAFGKLNFSEAHLRQAVEGSLLRLGVEAIDVYLLHSPPLELIRHAGVFEVLRALKQTGKIRFFGVSIHDPQEGIQAIEYGQVDVVEAVYNLIDTRIEKQLIDACRQTQTGLIVREPLARGFLSGRITPERVFEPGDVRSIWPKPLIARRIEAANRFKLLLPPAYHSLAQLALAYPLAPDAVSTVLVGCKTPEQVKENVASGTLIPLSPPLLEEIRDVQARL